MKMQAIRSSAALVLLIGLGATLRTEAFSPSLPPRRSSVAVYNSWDNDNSANGGGAGNLERIEFKIFPDGRVEETVRGIKGGNCHKVTEKINQALGDVVASEPTEEMFEQELVMNQEISLTEDDWDNQSSW